MNIISIARDFSDVPAGRFFEDGKHSGQHFRENFLIPALKKATDTNPVVVDLNDTEGYGSSFLEESFGGLIRESNYSKKDLEKKLEIKANGVYSPFKEAIINHINKAERVKLKQC